MYFVNQFINIVLGSDISISNFDNVCLLFDF